MTTESRVPTGASPNITAGLERLLGRQWYPDGRRPQAQNYTPPPAPAKTGGIPNPVPSPAPVPYSNAPTTARSPAELGNMNGGRLPVRGRYPWEDVPAPRAASSPATPIPPANPALNPQNLRRGIAPLQRAVAPAARAASAASRALPYIGAGVDFASGVASGESVGEAALEAGAALAGGLWGAAQGAGLGAAAAAPIAALIPPAAPLILGGGTIAGGIVGGLLGGATAGALADRFHRALFPNDGSNSPASNPTAALQPIVPPPFYGGQENGRLYNVTAFVDFKNRNTGASAGGFPQINTYSGVPGPIQGIRWTPDANKSNYALELLAGGQVYNLGSVGPNAEENGLTPGPTFIQSAIPANGQPDTGGNPAPLPGTPQLILSPANAPSRPITPPSGAPASPELAPASPPDPLLAPPRVAPVAPGAPNARPGQGAPDPASPPTAQPNMPAPNIPPWLPLLPAAMPAGGTGAGAGSTSLSPPGTRLRGSVTTRINPQRQPSTPTTPNIPPATGQPPTLTCRYDSLGIAGQVNVVDGKVTAANNALLTLSTAVTAVQAILTDQVLGKVNTIDNKLGPQIPGGGISGKLGQMFDFAKKTWNFLQIDRVLHVLTWIGVLHNAYMLSRGLSQTLFSAISTVLDAFGIEDADENPLDVGQIVGEWTENFLKSLLGEETVDGMKTTWAKYNRIYQAAANIIYSVQSMVYSMVEILETISNYVGKIGNALMRSGAILQNSFNWMNTNVNYLDNRFFRFLQRTQDGVEIIEQVFSEVVSIQEMGAELANQTNEFSQAINALEEQEATTENTARGEQKRPNLTITPNDESPAQTEE